MYKPEFRKVPGPLPRQPRYSKGGPGQQFADWVPYRGGVALKGATSSTYLDSVRILLNVSWK